MLRSSGVPLLQPPAFVVCIPRSGTLHCTDQCRLLMPLACSVQISIACMPADMDPARITALAKEAYPRAAACLQASLKRHLTDDKYVDLQVSWEGATEHVLMKHTPHKYVVDHEAYILSNAPTDSIQNYIWDLHHRAAWHGEFERNFAVAFNLGRNATRLLDVRYSVAVFQERKQALLKLYNNRLPLCDVYIFLRRRTFVCHIKQYSVWHLFA